MKQQITLFTILFTAFFSINAQVNNTEAPSDTVTLPGYELLDEVVVKGERPVLQTNGAKLTYNVDEDPASASSNALDILKKVPQVSVDGDGNVRLNGDTGFKFQVNGLDNPMIKQYAKQILEAMPANAIVKIEVITEPGAKEDAEGTAGIINIITERTRQNDGYSGTATLQFDNRSITPSLYGVVKKDKFTLSANAAYSRGFDGSRFTQDLSTHYTGTSNPATLLSRLEQRTRHHYVGGGFNMSWEPNADNLFTADANISYVDAKVPTISGSLKWLEPDESLLWSYRQNGSGKVSYMTLSANASYRHNFGRTGNSLILSYLFNFGNTYMGLDRKNEDAVNYLPLYIYQNEKSYTYDRGHTFQIDYSNDFNTTKHQLDVGAKGIFRHNSAIASYLYGNEPGALKSLPDMDGDISQPQNIYAAYASYTGSFGYFGVVGGLRYEHTKMGVSDKINPSRTFHNRLNDWVPNMALTWNFSPASNLRLAYQMRISRPSIQQVNPFQLTFSPYQVNRGNPSLTSERIHILSLKYSSFGRVVGGSVGLEYRYDNNAISGFTYLERTKDIDVLVSTYANIGKTQEAAFNGLFTWNIIPNMSLVLNGRISYNVLDAPAEGFKKRGWSGNIGGNWNYTVSDVYKFSAYTAWNSRRLKVQGYDSGYYYYGISAARDFLADKSLTVSLSANNFLQKRMTFKSLTQTPDVIYDSRGTNMSAWNVGISVSWRFGHLNAQVKKTGVELKNDDINSASNKSQGSL